MQRSRKLNTTLSPSEFHVCCVSVYDPQMDVEMAKYVITHVGDRFCELVESEKEARTWVSSDGKLSARRASAYCCSTVGDRFCELVKSEKEARTWVSSDGKLSARRTSGYCCSTVGDRFYELVESEKEARTWVSSDGKLSARRASGYCCSTVGDRFCDPGSVRMVSCQRAEQAVIVVQLLAIVSVSS